MQDFLLNKETCRSGSRVKKSTKVDLIVSNGQQLGDIIIPDLIGKKIEDAKKLIDEKKLKVGKITYQSSEQSSGVIVDQYPTKEKSAKENTQIDLIVTKKRKIEKSVDEESGIDNQNGNEQNKGKNVPEKSDDKIKEKSESVKDKTDKTKEKPKDKTEKTDKPKDKPEKTKDVQKDTQKDKKTDKPKDK